MELFLHVQQYQILERKCVQFRSTVAFFYSKTLLLR